MWSRSATAGRISRARRSSTLSFGAVEPRARPDAVEVVRDQPALERLRRVEGLVGGDVGEAQGQRADLRPHAAVEQVADRDHAAELVAVGQAV
jgi:hypothetical protein